MRLQHSISLIFLSLKVGAFYDTNIVKFCWQLDLVHVVVVPVLEVLLQRHRGHGRQTRGPRRQHQHAAGQQSGPRLERARRVRTEALMLTYTTHTSLALIFLLTTWEVFCDLYPFIHACHHNMCCVVCCVLSRGGGGWW